ncbi:hypothetical protein KIL84_001138 [Mauremys mutica]|uniref:Uncharacterized protein n=1 Tax=Mauremys mutica TaxID=74926 RepID=A0A9D3WZG0_9SAUR|nr:hypothetical protein KIL84_001138 [Mauremys mutica]
MRRLLPLPMGLKKVMRHRQRKQRSQELHSKSHQEPSTTPDAEEPPTSPEQEMGDSGTSTSSSAYSQGASSPSMGSDSPEAEGSLCAETPSAQVSWVEEEEEEEEDVSPEQDTIRVIQQQLQGRAESTLASSLGSACGSVGPESHTQFRFLGVSQELIENLPTVSEPSSIVSSSMTAGYNLRVTLTDSLTQGLCGRLDIKEMEDSSMCPGSVKSLPLLGFTIFLISLHLPRLDSDVFLPRTNPYQVALSVTLAGVFLLILLASYCFWKQHRGKDAQQAELKKKIHLLVSEMPESP